jgi:RNA polymerase sigma-70 factor (ECF subfamily)
VLSGSADALDRWYRGEHPEVYRLCVGFLAHAAEAEDAAQDAMLHLHDRLSRWDESGSWRPWRDAVVLNHCRDRLRKQSARERAHRRAAERGAADRGAPGRGERSVPGVLPDPSEELERAEVRAVLEAALAELPPREREAFVLRDLEQLPTAEVAGLLGIEPGSVRSLLTLAHRRLRGLLAERLPGAGGGGHA